MRFRNLDYPLNTPVHELGPAAVDALLDRGTMQDWSELVGEIRRDPFGSLAETVLRIIDAHPMYGTSLLFGSWIRKARARLGALPNLVEIRKLAGLTQADVATRLGISQSDVSKIERRSDMKLSTLEAYVRAVSGSLSITIELRDARSRVT